MSAWKPSVLGRFDHFQQLDIPLPAVHAAPADFAFGGEPFAELFGDVARLAEVSAIFFVLPAGSFAQSPGSRRSRCG